MATDSATPAGTAEQLRLAATYCDRGMPRRAVALAQSAAADMGAGALDTRASRPFPAPPSDQGYVIECEDCLRREFWLLRREGCITFMCVNCGSTYIDDEGFGRP